MLKNSEFVTNVDCVLIYFLLRFYPNLKKSLQVNTVESSELVVAQFSWYSRVFFLDKITASRKTNFERVSLLTETENQPSTKLHPHKQAKYHHSTK